MQSPKIPQASASTCRRAYEMNGILAFPIPVAKYSLHAATKKSLWRDTCGPFHLSSQTKRDCKKTNVRNTLRAPTNHKYTNHYHRFYTLDLHSLTKTAQRPNKQGPARVIPYQSHTFSQHTNSSQLLISEGTFGHAPPTRG